MRLRLVLAGVCVGFLCACGGATEQPFSDGGDGGNGGDGSGGDTSTMDGNNNDVTVDMGPSCDNLECQIVKCESGSTTLSGVVTTPNGQYPIFNAVVYIPNGATQPIMDGLTCDACQAPLTGKPLVSGQLAITTTDAKGQFQLKDVPAGMNIPIVVQIGKWRRESKIPMVNACADNSAPKDLVRLPKNQQEGHLPLIAVEAGPCDNAACSMLTRIGIDPMEFTPSTGMGRVHTFLGMGGNAALPMNSGSAYTMWNDLMALKKYDLLIGGCECQPENRGMNAYDNLKAYLQAGGRFIGTHYHFNWFANQMQCFNNPNNYCNGPMDFNMTAQWGMTNANPPVAIDMGHPRGAAFANWLVAVGASGMAGTINNPGDLRNDVGPVGMSSTRWMSEGAGAESLYLTFNTPIGGMNQCGRAAFSDMHFRGDPNLTNGPTSCSTPPQYPNNELAFTFLFFDSFSCVQDDTKMPIVPPVK